MLLLLTTGYYH